MNMQQLTFVEPGRLAWEEVVAPSLGGPGEAIVRPLVATTCDLDLAILAGKAPFAGPFPFGHEAIAEVVEVGESVTRVARGDRVIVPFQISCGVCDRCLRGVTASCRTAGNHAMYGLGALGGEHGGFFSDRVRVPFADAMLVKLPEGVSPEDVASASDNLPDAYRTVGPHLRERPGGTVLVVAGGAPSIGLYAVGFAKALGAGKVVYVDPSARRREVASALGAEVVDRLPTSKIGSFDITVDASANPDGLRFALRSVEPWGVCTSVGIYYEDVSLPMLEIYTRGVRFDFGRTNARAVLHDVLAPIARGDLRPSRLHTSRASWEDAPKALLEGGYKPLIVRT